MKQEVQQQYQKNRIILFFLREEINQALAEGWSQKEIWRLLREENRINNSYYSFNRIINALNQAYY